MLDFSKIKAVLFDHDGTLVDSESTHHRLWREVIDVDKKQFTESMYAENCVGIPSKGNAEYLIATFNLRETVTSLLDKKQQHTQRFLVFDYFPKMPYSLELIRILAQRNIKMAIVSGSERFAVERSVSGNGFHEFVKQITTGEEVPNNKPAPDVYLRALKKIGLSAQDCLAIEDTEHGVEAAVSAGIPCIAIPNDHTQRHDMTRATLKLQSLEQVANLFNSTPCDSDS